MTIKELLDIATEVYPDGYTRNYYDDSGRYVESKGDTLAQFIVLELIETFDEDAEEEHQLDTAANVMYMAEMNVQNVAAAFADRMED